MAAWAKLALLGVALLAASRLLERRQSHAPDAPPPSELRLWVVASTAVLGAVLILTALAIGLIV